MNKEQAIKILIQSAELATKHGAFSLQDAGVIAQAVAFLSKQDKATAPVEEKKEEVKE
jgi:hypothetical protein